MRLPALELRPGDRQELERRVRSNTVAARDAERARLVLLVKTVTEPPPDQATRWTMEAIARRLNEHGVAISASQVWRICRSLDLKPWQTESWMTSHDPDFWEKAANVCGLYLNPPENAIVWSVDEKSGIQAKSRINPTKPAVPGIPTRHEFEYRRHGTAVLFAGLNVHEGDVAAWVTDSTRTDNFVEFLADLPKPGRVFFSHPRAASPPKGRFPPRRPPPPAHHPLHQRLNPPSPAVP